MYRGLPGQTTGSVRNCRYHLYHPGNAVLRLFWVLYRDIHYEINYVTVYSVCYHQHSIKYQFCHRYSRNLPSYIQLYHYNIIYHMFFIYIYMISLLCPT